MKHIHPRLNDHGKMVTIQYPAVPSPPEAFGDLRQIGIVVPDGKIPESINGIPFQPWLNAPKTLSEWEHVEGKMTLDELPQTSKNGKDPAAGVVIFEPDGRIWLVAPTNAFGGYKTTFPKGRLEPGMSPQATAIKEAYEEAGLQIEITGYIGDFERSETLTRYYTARRTGGLPTQMGWEAQATLLVPQDQLLKVLNHPNDHAVLAALNILKPSV